VVRPVVSWLWPSVIIALFSTAPGCQDGGGAELTVPEPDSPAASRAPIVDGDRETGEPAVVMLFHDSGGGCTGTVIAPRVVLTAKHCVCVVTNPTSGTVGATLPARGFHVFTGSDMYSIEDEYGVSEVRRTDGSTLSNSDIAVLILDRDFDGEPKRWEFAPMPGMELNATITAIGYGMTESGNEYSIGTKYRRDGRVADIGPNDAWLLGDKEFLSIGENTCQGDSGGPLLFNDFVVGVVSRGEDGCEGYGWHTRVSGHADFIAQALADTGACVPTAFETCNNADDDCWGGVDDGVEACGCADGGAPSDEVCDGIDNDCNSAIDDLDACGCTGGAAPSDEVCDGVDNDCDAELDEGCMQLGEPCTADDECSTMLCREVDGEQVCTAECVTGGEPCPEEGYCDGDACGAGLCRAERGEARVDEGCRDAADCRSGFCATMSDGRTVCARPCEAGCFATQICRSLDGACGVCEARDAVGGEVRDLGFGEACLDDAECASGECFVDGDEGDCGAGCTYRYCAEPCGEGELCPSEEGVQSHCRDGTCVRGPESRLGESCVANDDCREGDCVERDGVFLCAAGCGEGGSCDDGAECVDDVCWPEGDVLGSECDEDGVDCDRGRCESIGSYLVCVEGCDNATDCPSGLSCVPDGDYGVCVPSRLAITPEEDDGGGCDCSAAGATRADALLWALGLVALAALRRRP
jgi:MYXO-CTERM domain-containing protein